MSLKVFHIFFILMSALLCGGFSWWLGAIGGAESFGSASAAVMLLSASAAGALLIYLGKVVKMKVVVQE